MFKEVRLPLHALPRENTIDHPLSRQRPSALLCLLHQDIRQPQGPMRSRRVHINKDFRPPRVLKLCKHKHKPPHNLLRLSNVFHTATNLPPPLLLTPTLELIPTASESRAFLLVPKLVCLRCKASIPNLRFLLRRKQNHHHPLRAWSLIQTEAQHPQNES